MIPFRYILLKIEFLKHVTQKEFDILRPDFLGQLHVFLLWPFNLQSWFFRQRSSFANKHLVNKNYVMEYSTLTWYPLPSRAKSGTKSYHTILYAINNGLFL